MALTDELAAMATVQEGFLLDTCTVRHATLGHNDIGEATRTYTDTDVKCRVGLPTERMVKLADANRHRADAVATLPKGTGAQAEDIVVHAGMEYLVVGVEGKTYATAERAILEHIS